MQQKIPCVYPDVHTDRVNFREMSNASLVYILANYNLAKLYICIFFTEDEDFSILLKALEGKRLFFTQSVNVEITI